MPTTVPAPVQEPDWANAPSPREASGVTREDAPPRTDRLLWIPRALLFFPRIALWAAAQPLRGAAYAYEEYDLAPRATEATFNKERTFGAYPVATYETGFGFTIGGRVLYRDVFDKGERLKARVSFGGRYRQAYGLNFRSGERFGDRVALEFDTSYERRPHERFYGIGNTDDAIGTRFREDLVRNVLTFDTRITDRIHSRLSGALMLRDFAGTGDDDSLTMHYDPMQVVGFQSGVENLYVEHELVYDSRRPTSPYQSTALDATGWLASAHVGMTTGVRDDPSELYAYGGEVQRYFDLYDGSRVLALRVLVEAVGGDHVSFIDLPRLGGTEHLRGYPNGRFRDRAATLGSAEYTWDLGNYFAAYTFVDVGRVWPSLADIEADGTANLRVGYGGGVQLHTRTSYKARLQVAASRDGDVFLELALSPAFGRRERAGRF
ncbi:MAG TPA: BamA/TamA family outer membrane protein [Xanthomonadales bacterium]|nr:BamA/TamA family outer membrane protein [Xanthomonadales bacterium]